MSRNPLTTGFRGRALSQSKRSGAIPGDIAKVSGKTFISVQKRRKSSTGVLLLRILSEESRSIKKRAVFFFLGNDLQCGRRFKTA
jgi:hypothetical protein